MLLIITTYVAMTLAAVVLVYRFFAADRAGRPTRGRWTDLLLVNLALLSVALYLGILMYPKPWVLVHHHDIFHYYMGSKYSQEVGYLDLYQCTAVAESENLGEGLPRYLVRKMDTYAFVTNRDVIQEGDVYRARFTPERWEEFKGDVAVFRDGLGGGKDWTKVLRDNGYNATPAWNMVAKQITSRISVQWPLGMLLLTLFDTALLALMFVAVERSFGNRTALLAIVFLGTLVAMADGTIRGAFLRLDWLALLVLATCALKRNRYKTAGALVAYAGMMRIFPLVFVFGLGAKWVWDFLATRRLNRRHLEFFVTFALVAATLFTLSIVVDGGTENWKVFWTKINFHDDQMSKLRVGFKTLFLQAVDPFMDGWPATASARAARFEELQGFWWSLQALVLAGLFLGVRRLEDYETLPVCWVLFYFLAAPTYYYQVTLLVLTLLFLPKLAERARVHGMALLFGISVVGYVLWFRLNADQGFGGSDLRRFDYTFSKSLAGMLLVAALYVVGFSLYTSFSRPGRPSSAGVGRVRTERYPTAEGG